MQYMIKEAIETLQKTFKDQLLTNKSMLAQYTHSETWLAPQLPDAVLLAENLDDIKKAVKICNQYPCPIIPFGAGTSLEGHVNAPKGGLSIDFSKLDRIIELDAGDLSVTVEPGVRREALNEYLRDTGLFFPIDPGANASIGGMTATRASGTNAVRYGTMKEVVLSIKAILPNGEEITTAKCARKSSAGYDLTRLLVGSEGTLAILTEITLRIFGRPEVIGGGRASFSDLNSACQCVIETIQYGLPIARIELLDPLQIKACNQYSNLNLDEAPTLFFEFHGSSEEVNNQIAIFNELADSNDVINIQHSSDQKQLAKLWRARHDAYPAAKALRPGCDPYVTDVCVPISKLAECVERARKDIEKNNLLGPIVGHVGDGNFHTLLLVDPHDEHERQRAERVIEAIIDRALAVGGTSTGEHGVGQGKRKYLKREHGDGAINMMKSIKESIDPLNIFNPGKIF